ncbi:MAG TPA: hypothetical protein VK963_03715 [Candidatus Saccharimonadales bacterium]|nr:hypothetical protein [Candidatus Saccharimonadales bacterium]
MAKIYRLSKRLVADPDAKQAIDKALQKAGIKKSKNTNEFTALNKMFFGKDYPRSTICRLASVMQYAKAKKVKSQYFVDFVRNKGGTAECARQMAKRRKAAAGASEDAEAAATKLINKRLAGAPKIKTPKAMRNLKKGFVAVLVKLGPDGVCPVLGYRPVPVRAIRTFHRIEAKSSSSVARKRP